MNLLRLEVSDWRRFRGGPYEVTFDPRSTVLAGPNEAGKSTLFEAIRRVLFDRAQSTARWVRHVVPYGIQGAVPHVLLEFSHAGRTWRIEKAFAGTSGAATLSVQKNGSWTTIAKGKDADAQLRDLLGSTFSTSSEGTRPSDWGAFQWLFVPQDARDLPQPEAVGYLGLPHAGVSDEFNAVLEQVNTVYRDTFTPTGLVKKRSLRHEIEEELARLRQEKEEVDAILKDLNEMRRRYAEIEEELPALALEVKRAEAEWNEAIAEHVDLSGAEGEYVAAQARYEQRKAEATAAARVVQERLSLEQALEHASVALDKAVQERAATAAQADRVTAAWEKTRTKVKEQETNIAAMRRVREDAVSLHGLRNKKAERDRLMRLHSQIQEIEHMIARLRSQLAGETPSASLIDQITNLSAEAQAERAAARSSALQVRMEGNPDATVLLDGTPLHQKTGTALESVLITLPGGSVHIAGDTTEAKHHADAVAELEAQIDRLLAPFGVASLAELRQLREERLQREEKLRSAIKERNNLDPRPLSAIAATISVLDQEIARLEQARNNRKRVAAHAALSDAELSQLIARLNQEIAAAERELATLKKKRDELYHQEDTVRRKLQIAESAYQAAKVRKQEAEAALDRHRDQYGSTDNCRNRAKTATEKLTKATKELESARARLDALKKGIDARRTAAKNRYDHLRDRLEKQRAAASELARRLEQASDKGYYARAAELERRISTETDRLARIVQRTEAVKLLKKTMEEVRSSLTQRIITPIKQDLDMRLAAATRGRYRLATLGDALAPQRLEGDETCEFADGSQGLRELVNTLLRMSVVAHLAAEEPQVLILDDPCVHVSRERTARVVELLNRLTETGRVQAIVLTHREAEFAGLAGSFVEVEAIG